MSNTESEKKALDLASNKDFDSLKMLIELMRYKYFIILFTILITCGITIWALMQPNWYTATVNMVPPKSSGSAFESIMGNISSTLKNFGLTKIGPKTDGTYSMILLLNNRTIIDSVIKKYDFRKRYGMEKEKSEDIRKAFLENCDITQELDGNFTISITDTNSVFAALVANDFAVLANYFSMDLFQNEAKLNTDYLSKRISSSDSALKSISDSLNKFSKKYKILIPEEQAKSVSKAIIDLKTEVIKQEVSLDILTNRFGANDQATILQRQAVDQLKNKLSDIENKPGFGGNFSISNATELGVEYMRLYTEYETFTKVKAFLLPMIEEQKLNEIRETKNFLILDKAIPPEKKTKPKRTVYVLGAFVGSFSSSILISLLFIGWGNFRRRYKEAKLQLKKD